MTKETRVGLLLALVFIVVFGMVLSELRRPNESIENDLAQPVVEESYYNPTQPPQPELQMGRRHSYDVAPSAEVAGRDESVEPDRADVEIIAPVPTSVADSRTLQPLGPTPTQPPADDNGFLAHGAALPTETTEETMPAIDSPQPSNPTASHVATVAPQTASASAETATQAPRRYVVREGDSLSSIAAAVYGEEYRHLFKKIYEANREQLPNVNTVYVGQELRIPPRIEPSMSPRQAIVADAASRQPQGGPVEMGLEELRQYVGGHSATIRRASPSDSETVAQAPAAPRPRVRYYIVQRGDSLTRIARKMYQDDSRDTVRKLYEANRDHLSDPDNVPAGVKLRLPDVGT
jgi:nucleoid-associated protein YgaU